MIRKKLSIVLSLLFSLILSDSAGAGDDDPEHNVGIAGFSLTVADEGKLRTLNYTVSRTGDAVFEGDIILGNAFVLQGAQQQDTRPLGLSDLSLYGLFRRGNFLWPEGEVSYVIDDQLPDKNRITNAIAHWEARTQIKFKKRVGSNRNYVLFVRDSYGGCSSSIGMIGGAQRINLGDSCKVGNTIHEIGHALGLGHEQCRSDRDKYVTVHFENIKSSALGNFQTNPTKYKDIENYDYGSIMHYGKDAFSKNNKPTIVASGGRAIGQRNKLSDDDIATIGEMYKGEVSKRK